MNDPNQQYRIGIAGLWITCNYGAVMTTFGLYKTLEKLGYSPVLIDQAPITGVSRYIDKQSLFRKFVASSGMQTTPPIRDKNTLKELNSLFDTFIVGSDQVWNYMYTAKMAPFYFLDFADEQKKMISYSSSFGHSSDSTPLLVRNLISFWLHQFNGVSCREKSGIDILREKYNTQAEYLLDPVFLCSIDDYAPLSAPEREEGPFIATYLLDYSPEKQDAILYAGKQLGMRLVNIANTPQEAELLRNNAGLEHTHAEIEVGEWLAYFENADFIVTDSFHGVCFSIIYSKPFICFANKDRGMARFTSLLETLGLINRLLLSPDDIQKAHELFSPIDYRPIQAKLDEWRQTSLNWLSDALNQPLKKMETKRLPYSRIRLHLTYFFYSFNHQIHRILFRFSKGKRQRILRDKKERLFAYRSIILSHLEKRSP